MLARLRPAGNEATGGGGGAAVAHAVEIAVHTPWPNHEVSEVQILVDDVDGSLLERFHGDELPVVVDVLDGQAITVLESHPMSWSIISRSA